MNEQAQAVLRIIQDTIPGAAGHNLPAWTQMAEAIAERLPYDAPTVMHITDRRELRIIVDALRHALSYTYNVDVMVQPDGFKLRVHDRWARWSPPFGAEQAEVDA